MVALLQILLVLVLAVALAPVARLARLPPLLGMIVGGAVAMVLPIPWETLPGDPLPNLQMDAVSTPVRFLVLTLVLLRAGYGLSGQDIRRAGDLGLRLGSIPMVFEAGLVALGGHFLLGLEWLPAAVLGFLVAAISPAIAIPGILDLLSKREGEDRRAPAALLVGAPLDNIVAILLFGVVLDLSLAESVEFFDSVVLVVTRVVGGVVFGAFVGWALARATHSWPVLEGHGWVSWVVGFGMFLAGEWVGFSSVLAVLALGIVARRSHDAAARAWTAELGRHWRFVQYALFGLIGAAVDIDSVGTVGLAGLGIVVGGQVFRALGSALATARSGLSWRSRAACALAYIPKASIQAAFAGVPLSRGLGDGATLVSVAVLAVVITAPLGIVGIAAADRLLPGGDGPATTDETSGG